MATQEADQVDEKVFLAIGIECGDKGGTPIYKPPGAAHSDRYEIVGDCIYIERGTFPVYLLLESDRPIMAMGFSKFDRRWVRPRMHRHPGPCGGCFTIDVHPATNTLAVRNEGVDYPDGYRWWLWAEDRNIRLKVDPRVYNHGETEYPLRKPGIFQRLWQLLFGHKG